MTSQSEIADFIKNLIAKEIKKEVATIDDAVAFNDLGLDSVNSIFLLGDVEEHYKIDIDPLSLYNNPTVSSFTEHVYKLINGRN
ncbi:MAG: acyl carrier protein [Imperialibacter sp.]|uniref:acyl carrier protein n=1 Tax=Imperialibacter sp. TaxID=2038411 RepID=UPI0032EB3833